MGYRIWSRDVIWVFELFGKEKGRIMEWFESSSGFVLEIWSVIVMLLSVFRSSAVADRVALHRSSYQGCVGAKKEGSTVLPAADLSKLFFTSAERLACSHQLTLLNNVCK